MSRRNALRAGVAVGVGVAAWSGASITSFGGTPAYAQTSTQTPQVLDIGGGCRNTTQASGCDPFGYQSEDFTPPAGFTIGALPIILTRSDIGPFFASKASRAGRSTSPVRTFAPSI